MEEDSRDTSSKRLLEAGGEEVTQRKKARGRSATTDSSNIGNSEQAVSASSFSSPSVSSPLFTSSESGPSIFQSIWSWLRNLGGLVSRSRPMSRDEKIADLETRIKNKDVELGKLAITLESFQEEKRHMLKIAKTEQNSDYLTALDSDMYETEARLNNVMTELRNEGSTQTSEGEFSNFRMYVIKRGKELFPRNTFGKIILNRRNVIHFVRSSISSQKSISPSDSQSVFISGCRGSGKTCLLNLIGNRLKMDGNDVFFFSNPTDVSKKALVDIMDLAENSKVVVIIDELGIESESRGSINSLLKVNCSNLITIGAAVPASDKSGYTSNFRERLEMSNLCLSIDDEDYIYIVDYFFRHLNQRFPSASLLVFQDICDFVLDYSGGHIYPFAKILEYFCVISPDHLISSEVFESKEEFLKAFFHPEFLESGHYNNITNRCFDHDSDTLNSALNILQGIDSQNDILNVSKYHWWNISKGDLISTLLKTYCLSLVNKNSLKTKQKMLISDAESNNFKNSVEVLLLGFNNIQPADFKCIGNTSKTPIENALSNSWAISASKSIGNVYILSQIRSPVSGFADFFINSHCNCIFEFIKDGTTTNCDEHLNRFLSGKYPWKQFLLVNFVMKERARKCPVALPTNAAYHNIFFTYVHSENTLYCGNTPISSPAVKDLSSSLNIKESPPISDFITP